MRHPSLRILLLILVGGLLAFSPAFSAAAPADRIVGADGVLYTALTGTHGDLFDSSGLINGAPALALEIGGERLLVPGTHDSAVEDNVFLEWSRNGDRLLLIWTSTQGSGLSKIRYATYGDGGFSGVESLRDARGAVHFSSMPTIFADHQRLTLELEDGERLEADRHLFHVVWLENSRQLRYTAFLFENGRPAQWHEIVPLSTLFEESHSNSSQKFAEGDIAWDLQPSASGETLFVSLEDRVFDRIGALEISVIAPALSLMSEAIAEEVRDLVDDGIPPGLADKMRAHIVVIGNRLLFDPTISDFFASRVGDWLRDHVGEYADDPQGLADAARRAAVEVSHAVAAVTLPDTTSDGETHAIDFAAFLRANGQSDDISGLVSVRVAADFPSPPAGLGPGARIHVADDGAAMAIAWQDGSRLSWTENRGQGWSPVRSLALDGSLDAETAHRLVTRSIR